MKNGLKILEGGRSEATELKEPRQKPRAKTKQRAAKCLPSQRISFESQTQMLRGFAAASGPSNNAVSVDEVAKIVKMAATSFPLVTPFFCDVGLLQKMEQKGGEAWKYQPSEHVMRFAKAFEWNRDTAAHKLAPIIGATWFGEALLRQLSFEPLEEKAAIEILAEHASATPEYEPQLSLLIDYLEASGLIAREGNMMKATKHVAKEESAGETRDASKDATFKAPSPHISTAFLAPAQGVVNFHVDVKINMDEFANWPPERITSFFAGIAQVLAAKGAIEKEASKEN